jgi:archaellum component FlaC
LGEIRNRIKGTVKKGVRKVEEKITGKPTIIDEIHRLKAEATAVSQVLQTLEDQRGNPAIGNDMFTSLSSGYRRRYSELLVDLTANLSEAKHMQKNLETKVQGLVIEAEVIGQSIVSMASCTAKEAKIQHEFLKKKLADVRAEIESCNKTLKFLSELDLKEGAPLVSGAAMVLGAQVER